MTLENATEIITKQVSEQVQRLSISRLKQGIGITVKMIPGDVVIKIVAISDLPKELDQSVPCTGTIVERFGNKYNGRFPKVVTFTGMFTIKRNWVSWTDNEGVKRRRAFTSLSPRPKDKSHRIEVFVEQVLP